MIHRRFCILNTSYIEQLLSILIEYIYIYITSTLIISYIYHIHTIHIYILHYIILHIKFHTLHIILIYHTYLYIYYIHLVGGTPYSNVLTFADFDLPLAAHQAHAASAPELFTARLARLASPREISGHSAWSTTAFPKTEADFMNPRLKEIGMTGV